MNDSFSKLSDSDLQTVISALRSGRLVSPFSALQVRRVVPANVAEHIRAGLMELESGGFSPEQIATALDLIGIDRQNQSSGEASIDLVTSGPESPGITNRDTSVVVRELFSHAKQSVMVVGYAVYQGQQVFESLANRMEEFPDLEVQFFLNIRRPDQDKTASEILVAQFRQRFKDKQWPIGCRLPDVFYDPRSVSDDGPIRSSMHAKCVVVDAKEVFVSSANFTEAAQQRNIEVGVGIKSNWLASRLIRHFQTMVQNGILIKLM